MQCRRRRDHRVGPHVRAGPDCRARRSPPLGTIGDVAVDSQGNIYVLDTWFDTVRKFSPDGAYGADIGREGEAPGEVYSPSCIAVGPGDRVYIAGQTMIAVLEPDGTPVDSFKRRTTGHARSMCFDSSGSLYVCAMDTATRTVIHKYDAAKGEYTASFGDSYGVDSDIDPRIGVAFGGGYLDVGEDGHVYYLQMTPQAVRIYDTDGTLLATHEARPKETPPPPEPQVHGGGVTFKTPEALSTRMLTLAGGRYLTVTYFRDDDGEYRVVVDIYDAEGERLRTRAFRNAPFSVMAKDAMGRIYVAEERDVPVVVRYTLGSDEAR